MQKGHLQVHSCEIAVFVYHGHGRVYFFKVYLVAIHCYMLVVAVCTVRMYRYIEGPVSQFVNGFLRREGLFQAQTYHLPGEAVLHWYGIEVEGVGGLWWLGRVVSIEVPLIYVSPSGEADGRVVDCEVVGCGEVVVDLGVGVDCGRGSKLDGWLGGSRWILGLEQSLNLF
jgi:hypothetical protein